MSIDAVKGTSPILILDALESSDPSRWYAVVMALQSMQEASALQRVMSPCSSRLSDLRARASQRSSPASVNTGSRNLSVRSDGSANGSLAAKPDDVFFRVVGGASPSPTRDLSKGANRDDSPSANF